MRGYNDAQAGQQAFSFRAVSAVRSNVVIEQVTFTRLKRIGRAMLELHWRFQKAVLRWAWTVRPPWLTVSNLGNAEVEGTLDAHGTDTGLVVLNGRNE